jgi:hypothetical protein
MTQDELTFSGDLKRWAELTAKLLLEFERRGWITIAREAFGRDVAQQADAKHKRENGEVELTLTLRGPSRGKDGSDHVDFVKKMMILAKIHCGMELVDTRTCAI